MDPDASSTIRMSGGSFDEDFGKVAQPMLPPWPVRPPWPDVVPPKLPMPVTPPAPTTPPLVPALAPGFAGENPQPTTARPTHSAPTRTMIDECMGTSRVS